MLHLEPRFINGSILGFALINHTTHDVKILFFEIDGQQYLNKEIIIQRCDEVLLFEKSNDYTCVFENIKCNICIKYREKLLYKFMILNKERGYLVQKKGIEKI